jgi:hypothetical protein
VIEDSARRQMASKLAGGMVGKFGAGSARGLIVAG